MTSSSTTPVRSTEGPDSTAPTTPEAAPSMVPSSRSMVALSVAPSVACSTITAVSTDQ